VSLFSAVSRSVPSTNSF